MTGIVDYEAGNIKSLSGALDELGKPWILVDSGKALEFLGADSSARLVLPGVGAFGAAMASLRSRGLERPIKDWIVSGRPFLGICLGLQLLYEGSEEDPGVKGLGLLPGIVEKFKGSLKIPAIGWNRVKAVGSSPLFPHDRDEWFYFVHSYHAPLDSQTVVGRADYGVEFPAAVAVGSGWAVQFHPEKSSRAGLELLKGWYES